MFIVFIGPPGAGKGTQAERLAAHLEIAHLSTGEVLRQAIERGTSLGKQAEAIIGRGELVPDSVVNAIVAERIDQADCQRGCLFDGYPRTTAQAESLDEFMNERGTPLSLALEIRVSEEELKRRLLSRGRSDDTPETIEHRLQVYESQTAPIVEYYNTACLLVSIDGNGTPDEVFGRVKDCVDQRRK